MGTFNVKSIREQLASALSREFDCTRKVSIYGAGSASAFAGPCFEETGEIACFIDETLTLGGGGAPFFYGRPVITLSEAKEKCRSHLILVSCVVQRSRRIMLEKLQNSQIEDMQFGTLDEYIFCKNADKILAVYDMLEDDVSKATYANVLLVRMGKAQMNTELVKKGNAYFALPPFHQNVFKDVFVDCGAYVGDTLEKFINNGEGGFHKIFAFEPDHDLFRTLQIRTERLRKEWNLSEDRLVLVNAGVGEANCELSFHKDAATGLTGTFQNLDSNESSENNLQVVSLDSYFSKQSVSFIKADIEGYEYPMLLGAEKVIKRDKPKIALSIYHNAVDMFRLALKIKEIDSHYKFAVRQHQYTPQDTVLYAYDERNIVLY